MIFITYDSVLFMCYLCVMSVWSLGFSLGSLHDIFLLKMALVVLWNFVDYHYFKA